MMILIFSHMSSTRLECMSAACMFISARDSNCFSVAKGDEKFSETLDALDGGKTVGSSLRAR